MLEVVAIKKGYSLQTEPHGCFSFSPAFFFHVVLNYCKYFPLFGSERDFSLSTNQMVARLLAEKLFIASVCRGSIAGPSPSDLAQALFARRSTGFV